MKKIMLSVIAVVGLAAASQAQFKLGVKASGSLDDRRGMVKESNINNSDKLWGYQAGVIADVNLGGNFYLQPQLLYSRKGSTQLRSTNAQDIKVRMNYVELPVNVVYKLDLPFGKAFAGAGGAFSYAVSGKEMQGGTKRNLYAKDWRREDISLTFTAGLEFDNGLFASINSQRGLFDIHKAQDISVKNRSLSVSVGYLIDWKKLKRKG